MLIIPAERILDWRRPPLVTLLLILLNVVIFFGYQSGDRQIWQEALGFYEAQELLALEAPEYLDYLERRIRLGQDRRHELPGQIRELMEEGETTAVSVILMADRDFGAHLKANGARYWQTDVYQRWLEQRTQLEDQWLNRISSMRFGLTPASVGLTELLGYQFLHGGLGHLIGNMVFLFLLGFAVEAVLRPARYLLAYLASGAFSGLFFSFIESGSHIPLVGASGAISGLMGMYVTIYGLKKIRFFFWAGVYFNYFRAPALWLLPVWVGKELFDAWRDHASNVAYMAHAGGLVAGAAIAYGFRRKGLDVQDVKQDLDEEADLEFRKAYSWALDAVSRVDFAQARHRFRKLADNHPDNLGMLEHLYHVEKLEPESDDFLSCTDRLLTLALKNHQIDLALNVYKDVIKRTEPARLSEEWHYKMLLASLRHNALREAEGTFQILRDVTPNLDLIGDACQALMNAFRQREMPTKVHYYQTLASQLDELRLNGQNPA